jgi:hypothetical protein
MQVKLLLQEGKYLRTLNHKNILKVLTVCQLPADFPGLCPDTDYSGPAWALVMEYVGVGVQPTATGDGGPLSVCRLSLSPLFALHSLNAVAEMETNSSGAPPAQGGTLAKQILQQMADAATKIYSTYEAFCWMGDIAAALSYLHNSGTQVGRQAKPSPHSLAAARLRSPQCGM